MGRSARTLVGLKHEVGPSVLLRHGDVGSNIGGVDILKRTLADAAVAAAEAVHLALIGRGIQVAHLNKGLMTMTRIVGTSQRDLNQLNRLTLIIGSKVLHIVGAWAQAAVRSAQALEKVVWSSVLLVDDHDVLKV